MVQLERFRSGSIERSSMAPTIYINFVLSHQFPKLGEPLRSVHRLHIDGAED